MNFEKVKSLSKKVGLEFAKGFSDSTAVLIVSSPIQAVADTVIAEGIGRACNTLDIDVLNMNNLMAMTDDKSIGAKIGMAKLMYYGLGWAYGWSRGKSRQLLGITQLSSESLQRKHDFLFTLAYSSTMLAGSYLIAGEHNWTKIGTALVLAGITQPVRGPAIGYAADFYRDFLGLGECKRTTYPVWMKNKTRAIKLGVAALGVAASIGLMAGIYSLTPKEWSNPHRSHASAQSVTQTNTLETIVR